MNKSLTPSKFSKMISEFCLINNIDIMEAVVDYCQKNNMEIETAAKLLTTSLKHRLAEQARSIHCLPKIINNNNV